MLRNEHPPKPLPEVEHREDCTDPTNVTSTIRDAMPFVKCWSCLRFVWNRQSPPDPTPGELNWPALVAACERRAVPVLRVDRHGDTHLIRTSQQLAKWGNR